jgi:hypothetical protein
LWAAVTGTLALPFFLRAIAARTRCRDHEVRIVL